MYCNILVNFFEIWAFTAHGVCSPRPGICVFFCFSLNNSFPPWRMFLKVDLTVYWRFSPILVIIFKCTSIALNSQVVTR